MRLGNFGVGTSLAGFSCKRPSRTQYLKKERSAASLRAMELFCRPWSCKCPTNSRMVLCVTALRAGGSSLAAIDRQRTDRGLCRNWKSCAERNFSLRGDIRDICRWPLSFCPGRLSRASTIDYRAASGGKSVYSRHPCRNSTAGMILGLECRRLAAETDSQGSYGLAPTGVASSG